MKKVFLLLLFFVVVSVASISGGKRVYLEKLREPCGFKGDKMGLMHTKREWRDFFRSKTLNLEIKRICPNSQLLTDKKEIKDMYDFLKTFAKDSNNTPNCK